MNTAIDGVRDALVTRGEELTAKQIAARFGVSNPNDVVYQLRNTGYAIYLNRRIDTKGRVKYKYSYGRPTRSVVAAGYRALGAERAGYTG